MKITIHIVEWAVVGCLLGCNSVKINPHTTVVAKDKAALQNANVYWNERERDVITACIERKQLNVQLHQSGYYFQIVQPGKGAVVRNGSEVTLQCQIFLLDGTLCYDYDAAHPLQFVVGNSNTMTGLHVALEKLPQGTEALFLFSSHLGYGLLGDGNKIPPQSPLLLKVKIVNLNN
ncbi:hypothetical protein FACS1894156_6060 [Bacteroidia bacterium]|nr:hypothetical protein FACS1894156_6060 [Bacteroidia bacterium]